MKLRHLRRRTLLHSRHPNRWRPLGYYRNRPHILRAVAWQGIGIIERVSMIVSEDVKGIIEAEQRMKNAVIWGTGHPEAMKP